MSFLDTLGLSSGQQDKFARRRQQEATAAAAAKAKAQTGAVNTGYTEAKGALAPTLTNISDIYNQEQLGRNAYIDILGLHGPEAAAQAGSAFNYSPMTMDLLKQQEQSTLRNNASAGYLRSGGTPLELQRQAYLNLAPEWSKYIDRLGGFDPMAANQQGFQVGGRLADLATGHGGDLSSIYGSKFDALTNATNNYWGARSQNASNVAGNWGSLASGLLGAGTKLFGMYGPTPNPGSVARA